MCTTRYYTRNQVYEVLERLSGENVSREYITEEEVNARAALDKNPGDTGGLSTFTVFQLFRPWVIRVENTPEYAEYLGCSNGKDLYPDFEFTKFEDYVKEVLEGNAKGVHQIKK